VVFAWPTDPFPEREVSFRNPLAKEKGGKRRGGKGHYYEAALFMLKKKEEIHVGLLNCQRSLEGDQGREKSSGALLCRDSREGEGGGRKEEGRRDYQVMGKKKKNCLLSFDIRSEPSWKGGWFATHAE